MPGFVGDIPPHDGWVVFVEAAIVGVPPVEHGVNVGLQQFPHSTGAAGRAGRQHDSYCKILEAMRDHASHEMGVRRPEAVHHKVARHAAVVKLHSLLLLVCKCF
jgi:hypothetical protein